MCTPRGSKFKVVPCPYFSPHRKTRALCGGGKIRAWYTLCQNTLEFWGIVTLSGHFWIFLSFFLASLSWTLKDEQQSAIIAIFEGQSRSVCLLDYWTGLLDSLTLSACSRVTVLILFVCVCVCVCVCVSLTTLEATHAKNGNQRTASGILFILKKPQIPQIGCFDSKTAV